MQKFNLFHLFIGALSFAILSFVIEQVFPYDGTDNDDKRDFLMAVVDPIGTLGPDMVAFTIDGATYALAPDQRHELAKKPLHKRQKEIATKLQRLKDSGNIEGYNSAIAYYKKRLFTIAETQKGIPLEALVLLSSDSDIDINMQDEKKRTLLFYATAQRNAYLVRYLLSLGADPEIRDYIDLRPIDLLDKQKDHALYLSFHNINVTKEAKASGLNSVQATYSYDKDNNIVSTEVIGEKKSSWSPLMLAIQDHNDMQALEYIKARKYLHDQTNNGSTALFLAIKYKENTILDALLDQGSDIEHRNRFNMNPLALAIRLDNLYAVKQLVQHGVNTHAICASDRTPIKYAEVNHREEIVDYLKSVGAS